MTGAAALPDSATLRVLVVAEGAPEQGGIPTFVDGLLKPGLFGNEVAVSLLNTTLPASAKRRVAVLSLPTTSGRQSPTR